MPMETGRVSLRLVRPPRLLSSRLSKNLYGILRPRYPGEKVPKKNISTELYERRLGALALDARSMPLKARGEVGGEARTHSKETTLRPAPRPPAALPAHTRRQP